MSRDVLIEGVKTTMSIPPGAGLRDHVVFLSR